MQKFWKYFKLTVLVWGFVSLAFVVFVAGWVLVENYSRSVSRSEEARPPAPEQVLDKSFGDLRLKVTQTSGDENIFKLSLTKAGKPLVMDYKLPTDDNEMGWISIQDARVTPVAGGGYRIALYSAQSEEESSNQHIWLYRFDGQMRLVKRIQLVSPHPLDEQYTRMFGKVQIVLPGISETEYDEVIFVPTQVSITDEIRVVPMFDAPSLELLRAYYGKKIETRMAKLKGPEQAELLAKYKKAAEEFKISLTPQVLSY